MTFSATQSVVASSPPYPTCNHLLQPPDHLSLKLQSKSTRISVVKTQQFSSPTTQEPKREWVSQSAASQTLKSALKLTQLSYRSDCECFNLYKELVPYKQAWSWQRSIVKEKKSLIERHEDCPDSLLVLQHPPVYTMGTGSSEKFLNFDLKDAPFDVHRTERGGEVTYHGPGQIVMYPIMNLRNHKMDLHWYLRSLEEVIIRALSNTFSIKASRLEGLTGVWHGNQKLAAIGIRVTQWITYHGLAVNVTTDLTPFNWIVPCGLQNYQVGSIRGLLGDIELFDGSSRKQVPDPDDGQLLDIACKSLINEFSEVFQVGINYETISRLEFLESEPVQLL